MIILFLMLSYLFAALIANPKAVRHISFVFPMTVILIWTWTDFFTRGRQYRKIILSVFAVLACISVIKGLLRYPLNLQYLYLSGCNLSKIIEKTGVDIVAVIYGHMIRSGTDYAVYSCINLLPDNAMLYPVDVTKEVIDASKCLDELLIWVRLSANNVIGNYTKDLTENG